MNIKKRKGSDQGEKVFVSIIVPTYNRAAIIHRAINSIKKQTFRDWECLIIDDHSTDNTGEVVQKLTAYDRRFKHILNNRSKGAPGARNTGIIAAHGKYVVLFDSDNVMHPDFLEKVYTKLQDDNVNICGAFSSIISESTGLRIGTFTWEGYGHIHQAILRGKSYFDNSSTLIERAKLIEIGLLDESCPSYQEWDTHIRLSKVATYTTVKEELVDYYRGGNDTISKNVERAVSGQLYILNKFHEDFKTQVPLSFLRHCLRLYVTIREKLEMRKYTYFNKQLKLVLRNNYMIIRCLYVIRPLIGR